MDAKEREGSVGSAGEAADPCTRRVIVGTSVARKREVMWTQDGPNAAGRAISGTSDEGGAAQGCAAELLKRRTHFDSFFIF